jgi:hypothetical protein
VIGILLTITICPYQTYGTTTETIELEEPKTLPLTDALKTSNDDKTPYRREVWQEDDREVLIRNERGAKETTDKEGKKNKNNKKDKNINNGTMNATQQKQHKFTENTNSEILPHTSTHTTHETAKKHQQKHEKHDKHKKHEKNGNTNNSNKKHTNSENLKDEDESKNFIFFRSHSLTLFLSPLLSFPLHSTYHLLEYFSKRLQLRF